MPGTPAPASEPRGSLAAAGRAEATWKRAVQWIPPKARLAVVVGLLVLIALAVYTSLTSGSSTLHLVCRHNLRTAELSVLIDGRLSYSDQISGSAKKRFGLFARRVEGTFSKSLAVPSGEHVVEVHLRSAADGFDQTKRVGVSLLPGKGATVAIATQRSGMSLVYQGPRVGTAKDAGSDFSNSLRSILVTVVGSAASAGIGFIVQEFLRSRKTA
jgi:hypothetical protein